MVLNKNSATLTVGGSAMPMATIAPKNAIEKAVMWMSSDATVATVDNGGLVMAVKADTTVVIVTTVDGTKTASCTVDVRVSVLDVNLAFVKTIDNREMNAQDIGGNIDVLLP